MLSLLSIRLFETVSRRSCFKKFVIRSAKSNEQVGALISGWQDLIANWQQSTVAVESREPLGV
jgi:hypothetical protein